MSPQDILVSTSWLAARLGDTTIRVVDLRWSPGDAGHGERAYARGHIPGAVHLGPQVRVGAPEQFRRSMEDAGVDDTTSVVAYDDGGPFHAARLVWALAAKSGLALDRPAILYCGGGCPRPVSTSRGEC